MFGKHIGNRLYDFLSGSMEEAEKATIESHLASCPRCSGERKRVEQAVKLLNAEKIEAPTLPESYWEDYWNSLEIQLKTYQTRPAGMRKLLEFLIPEQLGRILSPKIAYGLLGFALGAGIMLGVLSRYLQERSNTGVAGETPMAESTAPSSVTQAESQPLIQFFQRVKPLLIAVKNLDESKETPEGLSVEQEVSQKLAAECRTLKRQTFDPREEQLLSELGVVLVQLSKVKDENDRFKLDIVKEGIEKNDLLMKIRVHELAQEARFLQGPQK